MSEQEIAAAKALQDTEDSQRCMQLGFKPATEPYGNCRLRLEEIRSQQRLAKSYDRAHSCINGEFGIYDFR
ncbi:MAG: hypothetical protein U1E36_08650 [Rickettsiales bacterium]